MFDILQTTFSKCFAFHENLRILIQISMKFVPKLPIVDKSTLVQVMAWQQTGNKPLSKPMMA